jgi:hypothetical protein
MLRPRLGEVEWQYQKEAAEQAIRSLAGGRKQ